MSKRRTPSLVAALVVVLLIGITSMMFWLNAQPRWELSATNADRGLRIEVFKQDNPTPTYVTVLDGHRVSRNLDRVTIDELPPDIGETTFADETLKPGRWTLILDGVEMDIQPARLIIDHETELAPAGQ